KKYPASLVAVEREIRMGDITRRYDIVVYNKQMQPWMIVECKEMKETLNQKVLEQALRYNISLQVKFIVITNGSYCYGFSSLDGNVAEIHVIPDFQDTVTRGSQH